MLILIGCLLGVACAHQQSLLDPEHQAWLRDFDQMKKIIDQNYLNLEWSAFHQKLELAKMSQQTEVQILEAQRQSEFKAAMVQFLSRFKDPQLTIQWPEQKTPGFRQSLLPKILRSTPGPEMCQMLKSQAIPAEFSFRLPSSFRSLKESENFRAGVLQQGKKKMGLLRIQSFDETQYVTACAQEWDLFRLGKKAEWSNSAITEGLSTVLPTATTSNSCDPVCWDMFSIRLRNRLLRDLAFQISQLNAEKIDILLIDVGGAGGLNSWEPSLRPMVTDKTLVCGDRLQLKAQDVRNCDRHKLWVDPTYTPNCNLAILTESKTCPLNPEYFSAESLYKGPLFIYTNSKTREAAEDFAARMQDNLVGLVVGQPSQGYGCLSLEKTEDHELSESKAHLFLPSCLQRRLNGENEIESLVPDVPLEGSEKSEAFSKELLRQISFR